MTRILGFSNGISFHHKLIIIFFFIIVIPFLFVGYLTYVKSAQSMEEVNSSYELDSLEQSARQLDQFLEYVNDKQLEIIGSKKLQSLLEREPASTLDEISFISDIIPLVENLNPSPDILRIRIYPLKPSAYPLYMKSVYGSTDIENEAWFRHAIRSGDSFWRLFVPADQPNLYPEPIVSRIKHFRDLYSFEPKGVIAIDITEHTLRRYLTPSQRLNGYEMILVDEQGNVLSDMTKETIGKPLHDKALMEFAQHHESGSKTIRLENGLKRVTLITMRNSGWKLISTIPISEWMGPISTMKEYIVYLLILYLIIAMLAVIYISARFTNPIAKLVQLMKQVEKGQLSVDLPRSNRQDEVGWLYRGFDKMLKEIRLLIEEVYRSEKGKKELEFQVLTHQINPHFLYNTLESIRWKAEQRQASDISEMVSALGNLLRLSLNQGKEMTTVRRELDQVKSYVEIEMARQGSPIRVMYMVDDELMNAPFLRLLLQPIVENAIQHGLRGKREDGKIIVKGRADGQTVVFEIMDNGPGIPEELLPELLSDERKETKTKGGVGLRNVHQRLKLYFGDAYGLSICSSANGGTTIVLSHPLLEPDNRSTR